MMFGCELALSSSQNVAKKDSAAGKSAHVAAKKAAAAAAEVAMRSPSGTSLCVTTSLCVCVCVCRRRGIRCIFSEYALEAVVVSFLFVFHDERLSL
jgi:hypothetical protein